MMSPPVVAPTGEKNVLFNWLVPIMGFDAAAGVMRQLAVSSSGGLSFSFDQSGGVSRVASCSSVSTTGSTTAGVKSFTFEPQTGSTGTLLGQPFVAGNSYAFNAPPGDTLGAAAYTISGGTVLIYYIT